MTGKIDGIDPIRFFIMQNRGNKDFKFSILAYANDIIFATSLILKKLLR